MVLPPIIVKVYDLKANFIYRVPNVYAKDERNFFFFSNPAHHLREKHATADHLVLDLSGYVT